MLIFVTKTKLDEAITKLWAKIKQTFVTKSYAEASYATQSYVEEALQNVEIDHEIANNSTMGKLVLKVTEDGVEKQYAIDRQPIVAPAAPTLPSTTTYTGTTTLTVTNIPSGATLRWTIDGTTPTASSGSTGSSIELAQVNTGDTKGKEYTVKVVAVKFGLTSSVVSKTYTINRQLAAPTISNPEGTKYDSSRNVTITNNAVGGVRGTLKYKIGSGSWVTPTLTNNAVTIAATGDVEAKVELTYWESASATKTVTVGAKKCYIGRGGETLSSLSGLTGYNKDTLAGTTGQSVTLASAGYIWFVVPSGKTISSITSGPLDVPFSLKANSVSGYNCYRTTNEIVAGTHTFNIG